MDKLNLDAVDPYRKIERLEAKIARLEARMLDMYEELNVQDAKIDSMAPPIDGIEVPPRVNELVLLDLDNFSQDAFDRLPEWVQNKINRDIPAATGTDGPDW